MIELDRLATITAFLAPACLHDRTELPDRKLTAAGFGKTEDVLEMNYELYRVDLITYNNSYCNEFYDKDNTVPNGIISNQLCAGERASEGKDTCQVS